MEGSEYKEASAYWEHAHLPEWPLSTLRLRLPLTSLPM
jgi:hypothetical protein